MAKSGEYKPVVFLNSLGEEISNDPIFHAQKTLEAAGIAVGNTADDDDDQLQKDSDTPPTYEGISGKDLKQLAAEKGVDLTGLTTVGELRAALVQSDAEKAAADELARANS